MEFFAVEILLVLAGMVMGSLISWLLHEKKFAEIKKENVDLGKRLDAVLPQQIVINNSPVASEGKFSEYDPESATIHFGTTAGNVTVRLHSGKTVSKDVATILQKLGAVRPMSVGKE